MEHIDYPLPPSCFVRRDFISRGLSKIALDMGFDSINVLKYFCKDILSKIEELDYLNECCDEEMSLISQKHDQRTETPSCS